MVYHYPDPDVLLSGIRAKARETLLRKGIDIRQLFDGAHEGYPAGRIACKRFFSLLERVGGLVLDEEEKAFIIRRFGDHRQVISYAKFYNAVDIYVPRTHGDPEHYIDPLPQPYRRIMKVLEEDILERAWHLIGLRHPEVVHTLYTEPIDYFQLDLQRQCVPSRWVEDELGGSVTALAVEASTSCLLVGTSTGRVLLVNTDIGRISATLAPFSDIPGGIGGLSLSGVITPPPNPAASESSMEPPGPIVLAAAFINLPPGQLDAASKAAEAPVSAGKEKGKKEKKGGAEPPPAPETGPAARLVVLRVSGQTARAFACLDSSRGGIEWAQLSRDGRYLAVSTTDGAVSLHKVPSSDAAEAGGGLLPPEEGGSGGVASSSVSMAKIAEMDELVFRVADKPADLPLPFATLPPAPGAPTLHFLHAQPAPTVSPLDSTGRRLLHKGPATSGLVLWRAGSDRLQRYDFFKAPPPAPEPPADPKKKPAAATATDPPATPPLPPPDTTALLGGEWQLPSAITASCLDGSTCLLLVGLRSGSVLLWDLHVGGLREALGRHHESAVTTLALSPSTRHAVSAGADRRVHVYDLNPEAADQDPPLAKEMRDLYGLRLPRLVSYRQDLSGSALALHTLADAPLAVLQDGSSRLCVYDLLHGAPLGQLAAPDGLSLLTCPPTSSQAEASPSPLALVALSGGLLVAAFGPQADATAPDKADEDVAVEVVTDPASLQTVCEEEGRAPPQRSRLALLSTAQLIRGLCPAIASMAEDSGLEDYEVREIFLRMPPDERRQPHPPPDYLTRYATPAQPPPQPVARSTASGRVRSPQRLTSGSSGMRSPGPSPRAGSSDLGGSGNNYRQQQPAMSITARSDLKLRSGGLQRSPTAGSSTLLRSSSRPSNTNNNISTHRNGSSSSLTAGGAGLGALTEHNLSMLCGGPSATVVKGLTGCRYADPGEAMVRLKAGRNANKEDRDGRVMDALQELMRKL